MCSFTQKYPHYVRNLKLEGQRTLAKKRLERHVYPANMAGCINDRALLSGFKLSGKITLRLSYYLEIISLNVSLSKSTLFCEENLVISASARAFLQMRESLRPRAKRAREKSARRLALIISARLPVNLSQNRLMSSRARRKRASYNATSHVNVDLKMLKLCSKTKTLTMNPRLRRSFINSMNSL